MWAVHRLLRHALLLIALLLSSHAVTFADDEEEPGSIAVDGNLHSFDEVMLLLNHSTVKYLVGGWHDSLTPPEIADPIVIQGRVFPVAHDSGWSFRAITLSDSLKPKFEHAEYLFSEGDYGEAREIFHELYEIAPTFTLSLTLIGDSFYMERELDSAIHYFTLSKEANPADYQVRWFLSDALQRRGDTAEALKEITYAHLLNVNNRDIMSRLKERRFAMGQPWKSWSFLPKYHLEMTDEGALVQSEITFLGYTLAKALWAFEPGYADRMVAGSAPSDTLFGLLEEKEALLCCLQANDSLRAIHEDCILEGYANEFLLYEIIAKRNPYMMMLLAPTSFERVAEYIDRYH